MTDDEQSLAELVDVLRAEERQAWRDGQRIPTEKYLERYPRLLGHATGALHLLYNEVLLREAAGEQVHLDEYVQRFPAFTQQLIPLFEVHRALESDQLLLSAITGMSVDTLLAEDESAPQGVRRMIAGYDVLGELGRGGMGVVYKARQIGLNRVVALKMILAGDHGNEGQRARFRVEAEAVACLQHPNIVQIHEVGEHEGHAFFSMEFVDGGNLAQALDGTPQPARSAATLIETLARAIHAAHERGIIHRDLKPANVLLARGGLSNGATHHSPLSTHQVKISDFGLAKQLHAAAGQTASGMIVGTPSYMAPEQADSTRCQVGPAADVYALGAILYELLAGRPPFKAHTPVETLRQVLGDEPMPLAAVHVKVPRDLETICFTCLRKEPEKRYASALALADDLHSYLADRPIQARRATPIERSWRWCRRNRAVATLGSAIGVILSASVVALSVLYLQADAQRVRAEGAEDNWRTAAAAARDDETKARQAVEDTTSVLGFFEERVLAAGRPTGRWGGLGRDATIRATLDQAEPEIAKTFQARPLVEASIREALGNTYLSLSEWPRAIEQHERALALHRAQPLPDQLAIAGAMSSLALDYLEAGRPAEAVPLFERALKIRQAMLGPDDIKTLLCASRLGQALRAAGRAREAVPVHEEALRRSTATRGAEDLETVIFMEHLGHAYLDAGRRNDALLLLQQALKLLQDKLGSDHPDTVGTANTLGQALWAAGRFAEAGELIEEAWTRNKRLLGPDHSDTLRSMNNAAAVFREAGRLADALTLLEEVVRLRKAKDGPDHPETLVSMTNLAVLYQDSGRLADALPLLQEAAKRQEARLGPENPQRLMYMNHTASCLLKMKRFGDAANLLQECLAVRLRVDPTEWRTSLTKLQLGTALTGLTRYEDAETLLREAHAGLVTQRTTIAAQPDQYIAKATQALVSLYEAWGKKEQADTWRVKLPP